MNKDQSTLFAVYKNGIHLGNERGETKENAIKAYIRASNLTLFQNDLEFLNQYSAIIAINGIHHHFIKKSSY